MTQGNQVTSSGDGTRPTTSGGADNIGAGKKFTTERNAEGERVDGGPAPSERMTEKRKDVEATLEDDSAAFGLNEDLTPTPNKQSK